MKGFAILVLGSILVSWSFADEMTEVYRRIYIEAEGLPQKYAAVLSLVGLKDKSLAPLLAEALDDMLANRGNYPSPLDRELFARIVRELCLAIGDYKYEDSANSLWEAYQNVPEAHAKAEALIALGKLRALAYAERVSLLLGDLNLQPGQDPDSREKVAFGAILCLEKLRDPRGFSPVFFAATGWYSQRVRNQAERSLPNIADDPTDSIKAIIATESPERIALALKAEAASKATVARKNEAAVAALNLGHQKKPGDRAEARLFSDFRKLALQALAAGKAGGGEPVPGCVASYQSGYDEQERLFALDALGQNGGDAAAAALKDIILQLNSEARSGVVDEVRTRLAKAAIINAALARNALFKPVMILVAANNKWSGSVILAAQEAAKQLP